MNRHIICFFILSAIVLANMPWAQDAEKAAQLFSQGNAALTEGDFRSALKFYGSALKLDRENASYHKQYILLRRVIKMRDFIDSHQNSKKWTSIALALRNFYHSTENYSQALKLDRKIHDKLNNANSASLLAESLLLADKNGEVWELLSKLEKKTSTTQLFLGIALARLGKMEEAKAISEKLTFAKQKPEILYYSACFYALLGNKNRAMQKLTSCFEATHPNGLSIAKIKARQCKDFGAIASTPEFAKALQTKSKIQVSSCSSGSSCSSCPYRNKCSGGS